MNYLLQSAFGYPVYLYVFKSAFYIRKKLKGQLNIVFKNMGAFNHHLRLLHGNVNGHVGKG